MTPWKIAVAVAAVGASLAACDAAPATTSTDGRQHIRSFCDEHGNRVYLSAATSPAIAVVGQDPTCKESAKK